MRIRGLLLFAVALCAAACDSEQAPPIVEPGAMLGFRETDAGVRYDAAPPPFGRRDGGPSGMGGDPGDPADAAPP
ncbi:MAG: hypothetical protein KC583_18250, partial [Myxococcales bacterium]|nr:hypothetical protein [Myxococcales bacterium]